MKKFTPIAMKCTLEDWELIKDKFNEKDIIGIDNPISKNFTYLINHFDDENGFGIGFFNKSLSKEVYEKFDANIFLNACGIDYYEVVKSEKPTHYQTDVDFDVIDFCNAYDLNFNRGSVVKYVARAGKKDDEIKDLEKALDFIQREIKYLKEK